MGAVTKVAVMMKLLPMNEGEQFLISVQIIFDCADSGYRFQKVDVGAVHYETRNICFGLKLTQQL